MTQQQMFLSANSGFNIGAVANWASGTVQSTGVTNFSGQSDGKTGIFSTWVKVTTTQTFANIIDAQLNTLMVSWGTFNGGTGTFEVIAFNPSVVDTLRLRSANTYTHSASWHHILSSFDTADAAKCFLYIDDVSDLSITNRVDANIGWNTNPGNTGATKAWALGRAAGGSSSTLSGGSLAEVYMAANQWLDLSVASNRRKFRSAGGKPVFLGATGQLPTGTAPTAYFSIAKGEAVGNFATNRAGNGNLEVVGTLTIDSNSPSD